MSDLVFHYQSIYSSMTFLVVIVYPWYTHNHLGDY